MRARQSARPPAHRLAHTALHRLFLDTSRHESLRELAGILLCVSADWAVITLTTIGFGDVTPTNRAGQAIGALYRRNAICNSLARVASGVTFLT